MVDIELDYILRKMPCGNALTTSNYPVKWEDAYVCALAMSRSLDKPPKNTTHGSCG